MAGLAPSSAQVYAFAGLMCAVITALLTYYIVLCWRTAPVRDDT